MENQKDMLPDKIKERLDRVTVHGWNRLDLSNCGLTEIPEKIFDLCPEITILDISNSGYSEGAERNSIKEIPERISKLKKLSRLKASNNQISEINEGLGQLINLRHIDLSNNAIKHLPPQVANLPKLEELFLEGNPFDFLPPEIVARGVDSIRNFIKELDVQDFLYEAKLIIVGEGRVGKTCISNALIQNDYNLQEEESTEGINIQLKAPPIKLSSKSRVKPLKLGTNEKIKIHREPDHWHSQAAGDREVSS